MGLVHGVGVNDGSRRCVVGRSQVPEYIFWKGMLKRCYCEKYQNKYPTYRGCAVSDNFKSYSYFYDWCQKQVGFGIDGWQLDKDLLCYGNKIYSEDVCVFISPEINSIIRPNPVKNCSLPVGVSINPWSGRFFSKLRMNGKMVHIGTYDDQYAAFLAYKSAKEKHVRNVAEKYKESLDMRAYNALLKFTVLNDC